LADVLLPSPEGFESFCGHAVDGRNFQTPQSEWQLQNAAESLAKAFVVHFEAAPFMMARVIIEREGDADAREELLLGFPAKGATCERSGLDIGLVFDVCTDLFEDLAREFREAQTRELAALQSV
jgi:hypothetical protein